ncbi:MAG: LysR family transcriptional regulator [Actinomycetota bacterium]|nr:LysR family transcriptional regulator [Actinomycetota bacterium]
MDPTLLRTFVAVARAGSFSAAADELGYTQSAVSQQIAALERDLGAVVLERRPVRPTPAGERLADHARHLLARIDAARADIARLQGPDAGRLAVGCSSLALDRMLGAALGAARRAHPATEVSIRVRRRDELAEAVAVGDLDVALVDGAAAPNDPLPLDTFGTLTSIALREAPLVVALAAGHPLAGARALHLADLADARWLDAPEVTVPLAHLRAITGIDRFAPAASCDGADVAAVLELVATGHGVVVVPGGRVPPDGSVVGVSIAGPRVVHRIELVSGRDPHPAAATLIDALLANPTATAGPTAMPPATGTSPAGG